ncbi:Alb1-domain-containing protein [Amylocarpus encephaloides]|uniref:Alb1-domain-containing protein n=1 Tax=Amylocarpus encephaloides TaxID=45428 RepID=A0A9P8C2Y3_9HELO|nr:Alb1-domain-containing protein [Amylocarpus encephaloides]
MAKTAPKKSKAPASIHSRAAKRASSPGIDLDKSLKDVRPPADAKNTRPSVLAIHQGAGISKKSKNGRKSVLSARASRRKEKGLDRAEAFMDKKETKVEKSKIRAKTVQGRSKAWEEQNKKAMAAQAKEEDAERSAKEKEIAVDDLGCMLMEVVGQPVPFPEVDDSDL